MLYRPHGRSGMALSTVGVCLCPNVCRKEKGLLAKLLTAAIEQGVNAYFFKSLDLMVLREAAEILSVVDRKLLYIGALAHDTSAGLAGFSYELEPLKARLKWAIKDSGLEYFDMIAFDHPNDNLISEESMIFMQDLRRARMVRAIGAIAESEAILELAATGDYQSLITSFNIDTNWDKRRYVDFALSRGMTVFGLNYFPEAVMRAKDLLPDDAKRGFFGFKKPVNPLAGAGTYAFLHQTPEWTAEELCLGFALAQPVLSCVWIEPENIDHLNALTEVPEKHLPPSVPAQIEMARFNDRDQKVAAALSESSKLKARYFG